MCMLTFLPPNVQPNTERLQNGALINDDGHGFAILDMATRPGHPSLIVRRAMSPFTLIREFAALRKKYPEGPALFHSRWGTSGTKGKGNCHPFHLGQDGSDRLTVVAHNGVLTRDCWPGKGDDRCDTRIFAEDHLPFRNLNKSRGLNRLARWLGRDKLVILTANPRYREHWYLLNEQEGEWVDGVWYSNSDHSGYYGRVSYYSDSWWHKQDDTPKWWHADSALEGGTPGYVPRASLATRDIGAECPICLSIGTTSLVTSVCTACNTCTDCLMDSTEECVCYAPRLLGNDAPATVDGDDGTDIGWGWSGKADNEEVIGSILRQSVGY